MSGTGNIDALLTAVARIEQRQVAFEHVAHRLIDILEIHNEKLDAILVAASQEPETSPSLRVLESILATLREQERLLIDLRDAQANRSGDEPPNDSDWEDLEMEAAAPGSFEEYSRPGPDPC